MITAAIAGLGRWGRTLVAAVQGKSERLRFIRAVVRDPAPHRDFAQAHGLALTGDFADALGDPAVDALVLATPHSLHCAQVIAAATAGKHVFCEKPLSLTTAEAARAIAACEAAGVVLGIGTDKGFYPVLRELVRLVRTGELGPLLHLEAHFSNEVAGSFSQWRFSPAESPAGGLTGTGIHMLDALVELAGPVRRAEAVLLTHKPPPDPLDSLSVLLEFESGISGMLAAVRSTPMFTRLHAFGRHTSAEMLGRTELVLRQSGQEPQHLSFVPVDTVRVNLEAFADAAAGGARYPIPRAQILATVAATEAIIDAVTRDAHTPRS
jgi:predicted dehydrogenase